MGKVRWLCLLAACFAVGCGPTNSTVATDADESTDTSVRHVETPTWRVRGNELMESGDFRGAIAVYDAAIPKECDIAALLLARGKALFRSGEYATAERDFQAVLRITPGEGRAWQGIGDCRIGQQDYRSGVDALTRAIAAGRRDAAVFASRGLANFYASRTNEALADLDEAVRLAPDDSSQRMQRGKLRYMLEDYASAIADFDARLEDQPADAEAWLQRAKAEGLRAGRASDAAMDKLIRMGGAQPGAIPANVFITAEGTVARSLVAPVSHDAIEAAVSEIAPRK